MPTWPLIRRQWAMKDVLVDLWGPTIVERGSIVAQLMLLVVTAVGFYETSSHTVVRRTLRWFGHLHRYAWLGKNGFGVGIVRGREEKPKVENVGLPIILMLSLVLCCAIVFSGHGPLHWLGYPLRHGFLALVVWSRLRPDWSLAWVPLLSVLHMVWSLASAMLIYGLAGATFTRAVAVSAMWSARRLSKATFHFVLFALGLCAGVLVILTTTNWFPANRV